MAKTRPKVQGDERDDSLCERMIVVNRATKVVKDDRILGFAILTVVGDGDGCIDMGKGRVKEVPVTIRKAMDEARRKMVKILLKNGTLQYGMVGKHGAAKVQMISAKNGTGAIAGGPMRVIFGAVGTTSIVIKPHGSTNLYNMVRAMLNNLRKMSTPTEVAAKRGRSIEEILG